MMNRETPNRPEADRNQEADIDDIQDEGLIDPTELVYSGGFIGNPAEILSNPAVAPQMPDDSSVLREDLRRDS